METKVINIANLEALEEAAREFAAEMGDYTVYAFYGEMGAGKTAAKAIDEYIRSK